MLCYVCIVVLSIKGFVYIGSYMLFNSWGGRYDSIVINVNGRVNESFLLVVVRYGVVDC